MKQKIFDELKKCKTELPNYTIDDLEIIIPKLNQSSSIPVSEDFEIDREYLIKVNKSLIYPCDWYYTIHSNWNQGKGPSEEILFIRVLSKMGKMIRVSSIAYESKQPWVGWLPKTNVTVLERR